MVTGDTTGCRHWGSRSTSDGDTVHYQPLSSSHRLPTPVFPPAPGRGGAPAHTGLITARPGRDSCCSFRLMRVSAGRVLGKLHTESKSPGRASPEHLSLLSPSPILEAARSRV